MPREVDDAFYDQADAYIHLANDQLSEVTKGKVSASLMYACARFNAWVSACDWKSAGELQAAREETLEYFVSNYRKMLIENLDEYIENFDKYMRPPTDNA